MVCSCKVPVKIFSGELKDYYTIGCGKKCLNRVVSTECCLDSCPSGERCTNRRFQEQQHAQVYPIKTAARGWGLAAGQYIKKGQFIIQYLGEVYSIDSERGRARLEKYKANTCTYLMSTSHNEVIDPAYKGNMARFINHSCDPNCETQKWNVLGEVCVGIFAKKDIFEDDELTFDYRLDTHKTTLTKCLCGSKNCRQYLGLIPNNYSSADDWIKKLDSMKCTACKKSSGNDDDTLILCDICNKGWHTYCLKIPLKTVPKGTWICHKCTKKSIKKPETIPEKHESEEIKINLERKHLEILREHLDDILEMDVKLFWDIMTKEGYHEVTIRGSNARQVEKYIQNISKNTVQVSSIEDDITEIDMKFEKIYLKNVLNYYNTFKLGIHITYDTNIDLEEIYPVDNVANIILTGRRKAVYDMAEKLFSFIDKLMIFTLLISQTESKIIEINLTQFKSLISPAEVKLSKEKSVNESPHPFYFYSREERKVIFVGLEK